MRSRGVLSSILALALLSGCATSSNPESKSVGPISIGEDKVETLSVQPVDEPVDLRIIALANGSAEIVVALGLSKFLIGRDVASTEKSLESVPIVTSGHQVIPEKIIALRPTVVLIDSTTGPKSALDALKKSKISVIKISEAWTLAEIERKVTDIGRALGVTNTADLLNQKFAATISESRIAVELRPRIAFLYLRGTSSIYLMGGPGSGADSLISSIGAIDVGADSLPYAFNSLTSEALVKAKPDILLVMTKGLATVGGVAGLISLPGVKQTPAGKARRIISVDDSLLLSFGPRTPALLTALAEAINRVMMP